MKSPLRSPHGSRRPGRRRRVAARPPNPQAHRRPSRSWYPDCWDLIGGHIEPGETPTKTVIRECREELGITVTDPMPIAMACSDPAIDLAAFVITDWTGHATNAAPEEHDALRWCDAAQLSHLALADPAILPTLLRLLSPDNEGQWTRTAAVRRIGTPGRRT